MNRATPPNRHGHKHRVHSAIFDTDCGLVLTASKNDNAVKIWHTDPGECTMTLHGHRNSVFSAVFSLVTPGGS